jgi:ribosome-binding protein aMBF1 (putative translation factor)
LAQAEVFLYRDSVASAALQSLETICEDPRQTTLRDRYRHPEKAASSTEFCEICSTAETVDMSSKLLKRKFRSSTVQYLYDRYVGDDPQRIEEYEQEVLNADIARKIYDLRTKAGLSRQELARKVGTSCSVISRLEEADYEGNPLLMLKRIAEVLDKRVEIRFMPARRKLA